MKRSRWLPTALAVLLVGFILWRLDPSALLQRFAALQWPWMLASVCLLGIGNLCSALRWAHIARAMGLPIRSAQAIRLYAQGITLNTVLPGAIVGGDLWRSVGLHRQANVATSVATSATTTATSLAASGFAVLFDRISGVWVLALVALLALPWAMHQHELSPMLLLPYGAGLAAIFLAPLLPGLAWLADHAGARPKLAQAARLLNKLHQAQKLLWTMLPWSLLVQTFSIGALWCCQQAIGLQLDPLTTVALAGGLFIAAVIPISLGGFGSREAAAMLLYGVLGAEPQAGVAASVLYGLSAVALGVLGAMAVAPSRQDLAKLRDQPNA